MAQSEDITTLPNFKSLIKIENGLYLSCLPDRRPDLAQKFTKFCATIYERTKALPAVGSSFGSPVEPETMDVEFVGYAVFGSDVLVSIVGGVTK